MYESESESHSVVSDSLRPHGLYSPWNSLGQNTGVGCHSLLQGIFPTQGLNPGGLHCRQILCHLNHQGSPNYISVQFSSVAQCQTLCDPMNHSTPGLPVHHQIAEFTQTHVLWVGDAIHLILCRPLLLPPPIFPSIKVFSNESVLRIRWPKFWSCSFSISSSSEHSGLISFRINWLDLLAVQGTLKSLLQHHSSDIGSDIMLKNSGKWLIYLLMLY